MSFNETTAWVLPSKHVSKGENKAAVEKLVLNETTASSKNKTLPGAALGNLLGPEKHPFSHLWYLSSPRSHYYIALLRTGLRVVMASYLLINYFLYHFERKQFLRLMFYYCTCWRYSHYDLYATRYYYLLLFSHHYYHFLKIRMNTDL